MTEAAFRIGRVGDAAALHELVHRAYRGDTARSGWTHEADLLGGARIDLDTLRSSLSDAAHFVLLAEREERLVGCVQVTRRGGDLAYLGMLTVDPLLQGAGLGRALIARAEDEARRRFRASRMEMTVIVQRSELIAWYGRRGYRPTGERRPFPSADPRFGEPKRSDLAFVVLARDLG